ncbi:MAG: hypothetical protein GWP91_23320 [Rhodobacterales bacterium]|nr:hypothetical protein [Rhodobacterales bacterium]
MRKHVALVLFGALILSSGSKLSKMSTVEQDHYQALRVFMDKDTTKAFFKLKTEEERSQLLKDEQLWDRFYQFDESTRKKILYGEVEIGWNATQVFMAWGSPYAKKRLTGRRAARSEMYVYRFEVDKDGAVMPWVPGSKETYKAVNQYQLEVYIDDDMVVEIKRKEDWE